MSNKRNQYLRQEFDYNAQQIQRVVTEKVGVLRGEIESIASKVFLTFEELIVSEQKLTLLREENEEGNRFSFMLYFVPLTIPVIYFIDLLLSQDALSYLLPASIEGALHTFYVYLMPALFVIADVAIGLVREKIVYDVEENGKSYTLLLLINGFAVAFCFILPLLVGATILAFTETTAIQGSEVLARIALMALCLILHAFVIFSFPKKSFEYIRARTKMTSTLKKVQSLERKLYKSFTDLNARALMYREKSTTYSFIQPLTQVDFTFRTRLLVNQMLKTDEWVNTLQYNKKVQEHLEHDPFFQRFYSYNPIELIELEQPEIEVLVVEKPKVLIDEKPSLNGSATAEHDNQLYFPS
jgi:hypothetical protein